MNPTPVDERKVRLHLLAAGLVLLVLLSWDLGGRALWTDEEFSLAAAAPLAHAALGDASHPPLYPALLHFWLQVGTSDAWLRAFSIPWALLAWWLGWLVAARLGMKREGVVAAWLMALSPLVMTYFRMGRYYSMAAAVTMLAVYLLVRLWQRRGWPAALLLALATAATGYTDYIGLLVVLALVGFGLLWALARRDGRLATQAAVVIAAALGLLAPLILMTVQRAGLVGLIHPDPLAGSLWGLGVKLALPLFSLATGECIDPWRWWLVGPAVLAAMALLAAGLWGLVKVRPQPETAGAPFWLIALAWPLNILIAAVMMSTVAANVPPNRITSFALLTVPLAYLTMARGQQVIRPRRLGQVLLLVVALAYGYGLHNYFAQQQLLNPNYAPPWGEVAAIIEEHEQPGDLVLAIENAFVRYYHGRAELGREPEIHAMIAGKIPFERRVWLITRDRGSQEMMGYGLELRDKLLRQGATERVWNLMPRSPQEQRMLSLVLRRPAWDAYVKLYLFERRER